MERADAVESDHGDGERRGSGHDHDFSGGDELA